MRHYRFAFGFTGLCLLLCAWYGWSATGSLGRTFEMLGIVSILAVLEVSLSFDNAVVNAATLKDMDEVWQRRFLTWGMAFAVFGMRVAFPLVIVALAASLSPLEALSLALRDPQRYQVLVSSAHLGIAGFGGAFLAMVGLKFFFDSEKDVHWVQVLERWLSRFAALPAAEIAILLLAISAISVLLVPDDRSTFLLAGIFGIIAFIGVEGLCSLLKGENETGTSSALPRRLGLGGFLYLNVIDASFSFDGVIGAFALSNNMVIIALGLSIGAMFVRSMTIHLVQKGTLAEYRYLEHGAFWAILALAAIMLVSAKVHVPEVLTGLVGATLIAASLIWSVRHNRLTRINAIADRSGSGEARA